LKLFLCSTRVSHQTIHGILIWKIVRSTRINSPHICSATVGLPLSPLPSQICPCDPELSSSPIAWPSLRGLGLVTGSGVVFKHFVFKHFMLTRASTERQLTSLSSKFRRITPHQCFSLPPTANKNKEYLLTRNELPMTAARLLPSRIRLKLSHTETSL
jgi:hypothetical protein